MNAETQVVIASKAQTLAKLKTRLKTAGILPGAIVSWQNWHQAQDDVLQHIRYASVANDWLNTGLLIVRSSNHDEDSADNSAAGLYESVLNVETDEQLITAINTVFDSYGDNCTAESEVLIQPQLTQIDRSGVVFTREPSTGGFYYVLNYEEGDDTQSVTSGYGQQQKMAYWFKHADDLSPGFVVNSWQQQLLTTLQELEALFPDIPLDIEFAFAHQQLWILQARPLVLDVDVAPNVTVNEQTIQQQREQLKQTAKKINRLSQRHPHLVGDTTVYANMPDWNPAEIIGTKPKPLALSLYKELVTDATWAYQRDNYHYRNLRSFPLLISLAHSPYIDARVSFNSFIPKSLNDDIAEKLVNYYVARLQQNPELQDKVEFDIVLSCYSFDMEARLNRLPDATFSQGDKQQIKASLLSLTNKLIKGDFEHIRKDLSRVEKLVVKQQDIAASSLNNIEKIYWLIEDCKRYGTLPFAGIARAGFIARQILDSLVATGALTQARVDAFLESLTTVSSEMIQDKQQLSQADFLSKYGHLRPGTYDITSPRYDEMPERIFSSDSVQNECAQSSSSIFELTTYEYQTIKQLLTEHELECDVEGLLAFCQCAIEGREWAKFVFTRSLSDVLKIISALGQKLDPKELDLDALSYLDIKDVMGLYSATDAASDTFRQSIARHKQHYELCRAIHLPPVISSGEAVYGFEIPGCEPNFITLKQVTGDTCQDLSTELHGKIVFIPAADPGYDWIFSSGIAGFITMYGGANSHMAIRAGELGLPAIIGAGEVLYHQWSQAPRLRLDCQSKKVESWFA